MDSTVTEVVMRTVLYRLSVMLQLRLCTSFWLPTSRIKAYENVVRAYMVDAIKFNGQRKSELQFACEYFAGKMILVLYCPNCWSQRPSGLRLGYTAAHLLRLPVRILLRGADACLLWVPLCCQVEVSASGRSLVQRSPTVCAVSECDREASTMRRLWSIAGRCAAEKKILF